MTVVPVYNAVVVPDSNIFFAIDAYKKMTGRAPFEGEKVILMMLRADDSREDLEKDSFYPIGVSGVITEVNAGGYLVIRTHGRVHFDEITVYSDHTIELSVSRRPDVEDLDPAYEAERLEKLKNVVVDDKDGTLADEAVQAEVKKVEEELGTEGRVVLRKSGTEPLLRVMVEAGTQELCEEKVDQIIAAMKDAGHLIRVK